MPDVLHSPQLYYAYRLLCMSCPYADGHSRQRQFIKIHGRGTVSRVNGTIKMQQALNIQINAKAIHFQTCYFFFKIVATEKQLLTPVLRFNNCQATRSVHFSPRVCDFQPPCRSHAHLFERDNLHRTNGFSHLRWESSYSPAGGRGGGGGKVDIEKRSNRWQK